ncbi:LPD7 domain-containing protein, partial [Acinetobacter baumannii]
ARPGNEEVVVQFRDGSRLRDTGRSILITGRPSPAKAALLIEIAQAQGLKSITLRGSMEFKKDLALECYRAGIVVRNAEMQGF